MKQRAKVIDLPCLHEQGYDLGERQNMSKQADRPDCE